MEGHFSVQRWVRLEDPRAAQALLDPRDKGFAQVFVGEGISASEAARRLGMRLDTLLHRTRRWLDLGLLEVASVERGRGRPSRRYRLVSDGFVVPFHATQFGTLLDLFLEQDAPERERLGRGLIRAVVGEGAAGICGSTSSRSRASGTGRRPPTTTRTGGRSNSSTPPARRRGTPTRPCR